MSQQTCSGGEGSEFLMKSREPAFGFIFSLKGREAHLKCCYLESFCFRYTPRCIFFFNLIIFISKQTSPEDTDSNENKKQKEEEEKSQIHSVLA